MSLKPPIISSDRTGPPRGQWGTYLAEGIILLILGCIAIVVPVLAGLVTTVFLGWLLLLAGIIGLVATFRAREMPGFVWALISALIAVLAGVALIWNPLQGLISLTLLLAAFFAVDGILMIVLAISHRRSLSGRWEWMLVNGVIDLLLAGYIVTALPGSALWAIGVFVGIDLVFGGASLVAMALAARKAA
jgi:uncharacterized membrane protein HdeD (DUF308 family)